MVDILADGTFGRDDGIKCHACGGKTFLTNDQGRGLRSYDCESCDEVTQVQFDSVDEEEEYSDSVYWEDDNYESI